jgi:hypothetical protein
MGLRALSTLLLGGILCCSSFSTPTAEDAGPGDAMPSGPAILATGEKRPHGIVMDAQSIYWQTEGEPADGSTILNGEIVRLDRASGSKRSAIVAGIVNGGGLVADATTLFWLELDGSGAGYVGRVEKGGAGRTMFGRNDYAYRGLALDTANVLYISGLGNLFRATKAGEGVAQVRPSDVAARTVAVDGTGPYVGTGGQIVRGDSTLFAAGPGEVTAMVSDGVNLYWVSEPVGKVLKLGVDKHGELPMEIAGGQKSPTAIAVGGGDVYWTNRGDGTVMRAPIAGGAPVLVAANQKEPIGIAADASAVVWANVGDGTIVMTRRF